MNQHSKACVYLAELFFALVAPGFELPTLRPKISKQWSYHWASSHWLNKSYLVHKGFLFAKQVFSCVHACKKAEQNCFIPSHSRRNNFHLSDSSFVESKNCFVPAFFSLCITLAGMPFFIFYHPPSSRSWVPVVEPTEERGHLHNVVGALTWDWYRMWSWVCEE